MTNIGSPMKNLQFETPKFQVDNSSNEMEDSFTIKPSNQLQSPAGLHTRKPQNNGEALENNLNDKFFLRRHES